MNVLCIGDVVGSPGRDALGSLLPELKKEFNIDFVICNAENAAGGSGLTGRVANQLFKIGCDVLTLGDHVWDKREIYEYLDDNEKVIRPANFPKGAPGKGWCVVETAKGDKIGVINLLGRVFMRYNVNCPFTELKKIVEDIRLKTHNIVVDMHAETTSEKVAMGFFIDGLVSAVVGTHTHIQTADEKILPQGTAYITDLGMSGPYDSVIGQDKKNIISRFLTAMPSKFQVAENDVIIHGAIIDINETTGQARRIERIQRRFQ